MHSVKCSTVYCVRGLLYSQALTALIFKTMDKRLIDTIEGFDIYFEALEELLPEETEESLQEITDNNVVFCAKVSAEKEGIELAYDCLGGCIYPSEDDFLERGKGGYIDDMIDTVISLAKEEIPKIIERLTA